MQAWHEEIKEQRTSRVTGSSDMKRQTLLELSPDAERILTGLVHRRPRRWHDDVERLPELAQACRRDPVRERFRQVARRRDIYVAAVVREVNG